MNVSFTGAGFILAVEDPKRSAAYYRDVLGFDDSDLDMGPGWSVVERNEITICLGGCAENDDWIPPGDIPYHNWFAYIVVDDVAEYYRTVLENGGEFTKELTEEAGGSLHFSVRTVDGHGIMFGTGSTRRGTS